MAVTKIPSLSGGGMNSIYCFFQGLNDKLKFHCAEAQPRVNFEFIWLYLQMVGEGLLAGVWLTPK